MSFEFLKGKRSERLSDVDFTKCLEDPDFEEAVEALEKEMYFSRESGSDDMSASRFEKGDNFDVAFRAVELKLDAAGLRVTENAILLAVAQKLDVDGYGDLASFFDGTFTPKKP